MVISTYWPSDTTSASDISMAYLSACDSTITHSDFSSPLYMAPAGSSSSNPFVSMPSYLYNMFSTSHHNPVPFLPSSSASTISKNFFLGTKPGLNFTHINKVTATCRRTFCELGLWGYLGPLCWLQWMHTSQRLAWLHYLPDAIWSSSTHDTAHGVVKLRRHLSWRCHPHPSTRNSEHYHPVHRRCPNSQSCLLIRPGRQFVWNNSRKPRYS